MKSKYRRLLQIQKTFFEVEQMPIFTSRYSISMQYKIVNLLAVILLSTTTFAQSPNDTTGVNGTYNKIINLDDQIRNNPNLQVDNFNPADTASLPIGIVKKLGNRYYIICIDSAYFTPQGSFFNVYMAMDVPNSPKKVAFAAKGIQFNPQGVIVSNGAKLQLVSEQVVNLGPKLQMVFKDDGQNYIEWDCNGYKQAGLSIDFVFNSDMLINVSDTANPVKASMATVVADMDNITFQLSQMDKFKVKNANDFIFELQNITIDRSEAMTPQGVSLPPQILQSYNGDLNAWKGFYAANATVTLPPKLSSDPNNPTDIYAHHLIIDDSGVSGSFGANNVFSTGKMDSKWGFSLDNIQVDLISNHVTGGSLSGTIEVAPLDDQPLAYSATVSEQVNSDKLDYTFAVSPSDSAITLNAFKSKLVLFPSSQFIVQTQNDKFVPSAVLNGNWTVELSKAKVKGIAFQSLSIGTQTPYVTSGIFSLVQNPNESDLMKFPISLNSVGITQTATNDLAFTVGLGLNLGSGNNTFSAQTTVRVITENGSTNDRLDYDKFEIDNIGLNLNTSVFELQGVIAVKNDDPVFGDLFYGSISLKINDFMDGPIMVSAGFGKMPTYKYWFTDASVPTDIPLGSGVKLTSIYGGVQRRVQSTLTDSEQLARVAGVGMTPTQTAAIPFVPDQNQGLVFRAGVGLEQEVEENLNAEVMLTVAFNPSGGFQSINLSGQAYMMVSRAQRYNANAKKIYGLANINYDNAQKVFDANLNATIYYPNTLSGSLDITMHVDQNDWYFWLNRPTNRANVNLMSGLFYANAYFMVGTQIDPIPSPPSYILNALAGGSMTPIDFSSTATGGGFAVGVEIGANMNKEYPKNPDPTSWRAYVDVGAALGFDLMMMNAANYHCSGSSDPVGMNGYYCQGQIYCYLNGAVGLRKYKNDVRQATYPIAGLQVAALLQGKFPKPTYMYGAINLQLTFANVTRSFNADIEYGTNCTLVAN